MITCSNIGFGDQLGAQMSKYAEIYFLAKKNNQEIVFFKELRFFRRGFQILDVFENKHFCLISLGKFFISFIFIIYNFLIKYSSSWKKQFKRIYKSKFYNKIDKLLYSFFCNHNNSFISLDKLHDGLNCDPTLLKLKTNKNYDICSGFGTYQDWKLYSNEILNEFQFKDMIQLNAKGKFNDLLNSNYNKNDNLSIDKINTWLYDNDTVSMHYRLTDYLLVSSLNLSDDYYIKALNFFNDKNYIFLIFSDDINSIKNKTYLRKIECIFIDNTNAGEDLYLMSQCKNNIIANSSFSFWGAFLNKNPYKKVICPHNFIGDSSPELKYINGNYYPDSWIAI